MEVARLFTDDTLTSATYHRPSVVREPELELMRALLEDQLACVGFPIWSAGIKPKPGMTELKASAIEWIETTDEDSYLYSFNSICEQLGLHAAAVRERARQYYSQRGVEWYVDWRRQWDAQNRQQYQARRRETRELRKLGVTKPGALCAQGDGKPVAAHGLCNTHYMQLTRMGMVRPYMGTCSMGDGRTVWDDGLCWQHSNDNRKRKAGAAVA
jgi:hypothetical protein